MVAPTWLLMSSPTIGTPASVNFSAHSGVPAMKTGSALTNADLGVDGALGVELRGLLRADRQVADQDVDLGVAQRLHDVDRGRPWTPRWSAVVLAEAVEGVAALDGDAGGRHVGELDGVVLAGADGVGEVLADLLAVDVERGDEVDVADVVLAELDVHQPGDTGAGSALL